MRGENRALTRPDQVGEQPCHAVGGRRTWAAFGQPSEGAMSDLLLIDDDPGQLVTQVRQTFPNPGHRIAVARTGAEGVARVHAAPPDVVLLSLRLPDQCGLAVYRQIRGLDGQVPVIFVTESREAKAAKIGRASC